MYTPVALLPGRLRLNDQAGCDRIDATYEDNWNCCGCRVGGKCRGAASRRNDHGHAPADNISGQRYKSISLTIRGAEINRHVPAFDVTGVFQGLAECRHQVKIKGLAVEKSDHRHCRLLRARHKWPRNRTTEKRNEFPAPHEPLTRRVTAYHMPNRVGLVHHSKIGLFNVRFGSKADMCSAKGHVRFTPESGHCCKGCPLSANSGHSRDHAARTTRVSISVRSIVKSMGLVRSASAPFSSAFCLVSASP